MVDLLFNEQIFEQFLAVRIPKAQRSVWLATADIKDMFWPTGSRRAVPFLEILAGLVERKVFVCLLHAKEPGPRFREDFDKYPVLWESDYFQRVLCPRVHFKSIVVDEKVAYSGSANITGAGLGAKSPHRRNFEFGFVSDEPGYVRPILEQIQAVTAGDFCQKCGRREYCPDPLA